VFGYVTWIASFFKSKVADQFTEVWCVTSG